MASSSQSQAPSKYVTLISSDGFEFVVLREAACISGAIKRMLDPNSGFLESTTGRCQLAEIKYVLLHHTPKIFKYAHRRQYIYKMAEQGGIVLEKVAEYFYYNYRNRNREDVPDMEIPPELCLELLMAADFLDSEPRLV
ncbi:Elongin-C [Lachnellula occidentalis]|uniref:Elongin-C n=1 Tax=Lachnellula occidentalis TaxID=215460 RepID=A0A8H8SA58_9HELO|nr:Elongin-C [Lachnellula occidentalis]